MKYNEHSEKNKNKKIVFTIRMYFAREYVSETKRKQIGQT